MQKLFSIALLAAPALGGFMLRPAMYDPYYTNRLSQRYYGDADISARLNLNNRGPQSASQSIGRSSLSANGGNGNRVNDGLLAGANILDESGLVPVNNANIGGSRTSRNTGNVRGSQGGLAGRSVNSYGGEGNDGEYNRGALSGVNILDRSGLVPVNDPNILGSDTSGNSGDVDGMQEGPLGGLLG